MAKEVFQERPKNRRVIVVTLLLLLTLQIGLVAAGEYDDILKPVTKIYDLVKHVATVISSLILLFAGITYITSGSDPGKRDKAKNMIMYVIIGLIVIWAAPYIVKLVVE